MNGYVVGVQGPVVDVEFNTHEDIPSLYEVLCVKTVDDLTINLEVIEHLGAKLVRCIALASTLNLQFNAPVESMHQPLTIPVGQELFGRVINVCGQAIDKKGEVITSQRMPIRKSITGIKLNPDILVNKDPQILETGIKVIDLLFPMVKGSKTGVLGGAALGKSILTLEFIHNVVQRGEGVCVFTGAGERIREGNELYQEFKRQNILDKVMMAFGQMDESPGARFEIALTGVTLAEYLQQQNKDVLFFIDNVFRFVQAGAEISTLLGRIPSETGYQPTLASEVSDFQERIRQQGGGSITAVEAVYVPADDLADPAVVTIFSYLDSIIVLSREKVQQGLYPAIDPLLSTCSNLDVSVVGREHFNLAQDCLRILTKYEELKRIVLVMGVDELSREDKTLYERARKLQNFLTQPFFVAHVYTGKQGEYVPIEDTLRGVKMIIDGELDAVSEEKLYLIGKIEQALS